MRTLTLPGILCFTCLWLVPVQAAPPASVSGQVLHYQFLIPSLRKVTESVIQLGPDGRFEAIYESDGSVLGVFSYRTGIRAATARGGYTYATNGDNTATLIFSFDDRQAILDRDSFTLSFDTATSGKLWSLNYTPEQGDFYLMDPMRLAEAPMVNLSVRGHVTSGHPLIAGLIVPGAAPKMILIRAVGPTLTQFGVDHVWADPDFTLYQGQQPYRTQSMHYSDWAKYPFGTIPAQDSVVQQNFSALFSALHIFPLQPGSGDAVQVAWLEPGAYTVVCSAPATDPGGEALIEAYSFP